MPYIKRERRDAALGCPSTSGELNYALTTMILNFLGPSPDYVSFNTAIGVLECCKLEMYRRAVAPYEDKKRDENGEVYPC